jgi:hypothetical protein
MNPEELDEFNRRVFEMMERMGFKPRTEEEEATAEAQANGLERRKLLYANTKGE